MHRLGEVEREKGIGKTLKVSPHILMGTFSNKDTYNIENQGELKYKNYDTKYVTGLAHKFYHIDKLLE